MAYIYGNCQIVIIVMITIKKGCEAVTFRERVHGVGLTDSRLGRGSGTCKGRGWGGVEGGTCS